MRSLFHAQICGFSWNCQPGNKRFSAIRYPVMGFALPYRRKPPRFFPMFGYLSAKFAPLTWSGASFRGIAPHRRVPQLSPETDTFTMPHSWIPYSRRTGKRAVRPSNSLLLPQLQARGAPHKRIPT